MSPHFARRVQERIGMIRALLARLFRPSPLRDENDQLRAILGGMFETEDHLRSEISSLRARLAAAEARAMPDEGADPRVWPARWAK